MTIITADIRITVKDEREATALKALLTAALGATLEWRTTHRGRGDGVWFIRGTLRYDPDALEQRLVEAILRDTGELVSIPDPRPATPAVVQPDPAAALRQTRLRSLSRPETQPDDGVDKRQLHKRLQQLKDKEKPS